MSDLLKRLRGKYSCGSEGIHEDRDFGSFTPRICSEAADKIEQLEQQNKELRARVYQLHDNLFTAVIGLEWYIDQFPEAASPDDDENMENFKSALDATPKQNLRDIEIAALKKMLIQFGFTYGVMPLSGSSISVVDICHYIWELKEQGE